MMNLKISSIAFHFIFSRWIDLIDVKESKIFRRIYLQVKKFRWLTYWNIKFNDYNKHKIEIWHIWIKTNVSIERRWTIFWNDLNSWMNIEIELDIYNKLHPSILLSIHSKNASIALDLDLICVVFTISILKFSRW